MREKVISIAVTVIALAAVSLAQSGDNGVVADTVPPAPAFQLFTRAAPPSPVSQSIAGAGTAMVLDGFGGLVNPALTNAEPRSAGAFAAGFGRDRVFDRFTLPFAALVADESGMMGFYYRYLSGSQGFVHDAVINLAGTVAGQVDAQGAVEFGLNFRYEHSVWRHYAVDSMGNKSLDANGNQLTANLRGRSLLLDIGFYQPHVAPGLDFSLVITNVTGYVWKDVDGKNNSKGQLDDLYRTLIVGLFYTLPLGNSLALGIPFDIEMANLFKKSVPDKYIVRAGAELRIVQTYYLRFGYAHAPDNPLDLVSDFDYRDLFFGGAGVNVRPMRFDFYAGKEEFGITATYRY